MKVDFGIAAAALRDPRAEAARAEEDGYDAVWATELKHDPFIGLTLAATTTHRVDLGTSIALAFARNPMSMAVLANDLQDISRGRFLLGLGTQVKSHISRRFSMPWSEPAPRIREFVLAMRTIWHCWQDGAPLDFEGAFYRHTLMTPMFVPEAHPYGPPKILLAGVGPAITEAAGEVADGFIAHGFTTERYLREVTMPALLAGRGKRAAPTGEFEVCGNPLVVTGETSEHFAEAKARARAQIAFYGSTPAYRGVLELHDWGDLATELHKMSRAGQWSEMGALIDDSVLDTFAVVAEPSAVAPELLRRFGDILTRLTLNSSHELDKTVQKEVAVALRTG